MYADEFAICQQNCLLSAAKFLIKMETEARPRVAQMKTSVSKIQIWTAQEHLCNVQK